MSACSDIFGSAEENKSDAKINQRSQEIGQRNISAVFKFKNKKRFNRKSLLTLSDFLINMSFWVPGW